MDSKEATATEKPAVMSLKVTQAQVLPQEKVYPRVGAHEWRAWPILAIETGGYADLEVYDAWTGRAAHCFAYKCPKHDRHAPDPIGLDKPCEDCANTTIYDALRRLIDALEAARFFEEAETQAQAQAAG